MVAVLVPLLMVEALLVQAALLPMVESLSVLLIPLLNPLVPLLP